MVKENTHLFIADRVFRKFKNKDLKRVIKSNVAYYFLGSVVLDSFLYDLRFQDVSYGLHGEKGELTNKVIFEMLDFAKKKKGNADKDLAFAMGYLSHCASDIVFHPIIYFLSGNYYDKNHVKRKNAMYVHRHLETFIDKKLNKNHHVDEVIKPDLINDLIFPEVIHWKKKIKASKIKKFLKRQRFAYKYLYRTKTAYNLACFLSKLRIVPYQFLGLFYANLEKDKSKMANIIKYRDLLTGRNKVTSLNKLLEDSIRLSEKMINSAYAYYLGRINKKDCSKVIRGESLSTGKVGVGVKKIKYVAELQK